MVIVSSPGMAVGLAGCLAVSPMAGWLPPEARREPNSRRALCVRARRRPFARAGRKRHLIPMLVVVVGGVTVVLVASSRESGPVWATSTTMSMAFNSSFMPSREALELSCRWSSSSSSLLLSLLAL